MDRLSVFRDHNEPFERRVLHALDYLIELTITEGVRTHMDLTRLTDDVTAETTVTQSAVTLLNQLAQEIRDAGGNQEALDAIATNLEQNSQQLADAVAANTPASGADAGTGNTGADGQPPAQ